MSPSKPALFGNTRRISWIAAGGLAAVICFGAYAGTSYVSANKSVDHALEALAAADDWLVALYDVHTGARGFSLSGDPAELTSYERALSDERTIAGRVRALVAEDEIQARNVAQADEHALAVVAGNRELVAKGMSNRRSEAQAWIASGESMRLIETFRKDWNEIRETEERLLLERREAMQRRALLTIVAAVVLVGAALSLLWLSFRLMRGRAQALERQARAARERLRALSDVAAALSGARRREEVAKKVVEEGARIAQADVCMLYVANEEATVLELIGDRGVAPELFERIRRIERGAGNPVFENLEAQRALWLENEAEFRAAYPNHAAGKAAGRPVRAFWSLPLVVEGKPIGLLGMGSYEPRYFSEDDRTLVQTLAQQCAQALLRAMRLEREESARQWLNTTLRSIGDAVIATDIDGRVTFINRVAATLTGFSEAEARGRPLEEVFAIFSEQTREPVESPVAKVLREGRVVGLANHTVLRSRSGAEIAIDDSGAPIRNDAGRLLGVVLVFRDVTREKGELARREFLAKAGEALVSSLDYEVTLATIARLAVPTIADWCAVEILDPGATVSRQAAAAHVEPNKLKFAEELARRYPPDPNARRGVPEVIRTGKAELYKEIPSALLEAAAQDEEHLRLIRELRLESGMVVPLRVHGRTHGAMTFVYADSGRRYDEQDLAFAQDFARQAAVAIENAIALRTVEAGREIEHRLRAAAEVASRAKDEFLAMVSHELRTPLNAILGWAIVLRRRSPSAESDRALAIIERNANAQAKLIEDVLDLSRIISGKLTLSLGPTNVNDAVSVAVETVGPAAEAKHVAIEQDLAADLPSIVADADRVKQVIWNLVSNAVKFSAKGSSVSVRTRKGGSDVLIEVEDSGEGIRSDALPFIFDAFQQADLSTTRRHGGLGLGLAIVKQLVSAHRGSVRAESGGEGKGALFVVSLPVPAAASGVVEALRPTAPLGSAEAIEQARLDGLRVLVVDDEVDALGLVREALRDSGAEVLTAGSAAEAMAMFTVARPDVVVSDIGMPGEDGYSLLRRIRALSAAQGGRTPAVALTAYARAEDAQRALAAGYQMHVAKPTSPDRLSNVVAFVAGRSRHAV